MTAFEVRPRFMTAWVLRLLAAGGLVVDAVIHLQLAGLYQLAAPGGIGQGNLFRIEAVIAILSAILLLLKAHWLTYLLCFLVAASALGAVLLYRYVDVGALGPLPSMYEPLWFTKKTVTAIAEALAMVASGAGLLLVRRRETSKQSVRTV